MTGSSPDWLVAEALAPATSGHLDPLYRASSQGTLAMPFCASCDQALELEQSVCHRCGRGGPRWKPVEPAGTVHAVTTVHRSERPLIVSEDPYHVIDVELHSGHRVVMTTTHPLADAPRIGDHVGVGFRNIGGVAVPAVVTQPTDTEVSP